MSFCGGLGSSRQDGTDLRGRLVCLTVRGRPRRERYTRRREANGRLQTARDMNAEELGHTHLTAHQFNVGGSELRRGMSLTV